jgi:hypothetical protein
MERNWEPVEGLADGSAEVLDGLSASTGDLVDSDFDDISPMRLNGIEFVQGGEQKISAKTGNPYVTSDQILWHSEALNEAAELFDDPHFRQVFFLPRVVNGKRGKIKSTDDYGITLTQLEQLGISTNAEVAHVFHMKRIYDLIGMLYHRQRATFADEKMKKPKSITVPVAVFGFDNEYRASLGLAPAYFKGKEPKKRVAAAPAADAEDE